MQIERIAPWGEWVAIIQPCYYKGECGNKPYDLELMRRLHLLRPYSRAFSEFCGVDSSNQVPDGDTIGRFRNILVDNGLQEKIFAQVIEA